MTDAGRVAIWGFIITTAIAIVWALLERWRRYRNDKLWKEAFEKRQRQFEDLKARRNSLEDDEEKIAKTAAEEIERVSKEIQNESKENVRRRFFDSFKPGQRGSRRSG